MKRQYIYIKQDSDLEAALEVAQSVDVWAKLDTDHNRVIRVYEYDKIAYALATNNIWFNGWQ